MGSKAGKVIGPVRRKGSFQVPHVTGSSNKECLTTMLSASATGIIMPPFLVYPRPKPTRCNPLDGALQGTVIEYTTKGWMDSLTFVKFINHFDQHAGPQRPVLLLIDVSSHVDMEAFPTAASKGIELYRLIPNTTYLLQPLDKGVFGALKNQVVTGDPQIPPSVPWSQNFQAQFCGKTDRSLQQLLSSQYCYQLFFSSWHISCWQEQNYQWHACSWNNLLWSRWPEHYPTTPMKHHKMKWNMPRGL